MVHQLSTHNLVKTSESRTTPKITPELKLFGPSDKVNICRSGAIQRLVANAPVTIAKTIEVVDPSILGRHVFLPWHRDNWCTMSPCLTVTNTTQRVTEVLKFERWVASKQREWFNTFAPLLFEQKGEIYWYAPIKQSDWTFYLRNATHGFKDKEYIKPLQTKGGCEHWVNVSGNTLPWMNFHYRNYGH